MNDLSGSNKELVEEITALKEKIRVLEQLATQHEQTEDDLRLSLQQLRLLINTGPDFFFLKDLELRYQLVNSANAHFFGRDESEILGKTDLELMPEESARACMESDHLAIRENRLVVTVETVGERYYETYKFPIVVGGKTAGVAGIVRDITDHKRAEEALQLNAERTEALLQLHQMAEAPLQEITDFALEKAVHLTRSAVGYLAFLNEDESVLTMHSWSGNAMAECTIPQKPTHYSVMKTGLWGEAVRQRKAITTNDYNQPNPLKKGYPAGHIRILRHLNVPVFSGNRIVLVIGVGNKEDEYNQTDIEQLKLLMEGMWRLVERKQTVEALRESEERLRTLFESSRDAILMMDPEGKVSYWNPAAERIFGYASVEAIGRNLHELLAPERYHEAHRTAYAQFLRTGKGWAIGRTLELQAIRKDGSEITVALSLSAERIKDSWHAMGIIRDITEEKEAQEALKQSRSLLSSIIEFLPDAIFAINLEGKVISWNRALEEMTGFSAETMLGKGDYEYAIPFYGERRPLFVNLLLSWDENIAGKYSTIKKDGDTIYAEAEVPFVKGPKRYLWGKASLLRNEQGEVIGAIASIRDMTERKFLESQLLQARKMESVGTLAGGVAHDFNNILMGIQGHASLMMLELDANHPHYEHLKGIEEQVKSASDLTRQLLGFARGGKYEVEATDMNEVIKKTSTMFGRTKKELAIHKKYEKDLWTVEVDRGQMEQVLLNLYVNAWHAMPEGGKLILETSNTVVDEKYAALHGVLPGKYVMISVTDTGTGMEEEIKKRIFDPFFTTKEMGRGTGLGLAMVYGIIKGHNGLIDVFSKPGCGTTFNIYLPASDKRIREQKPPVSKVVKGTGTILLIDDEPAVLAVSKKILESLGYTVYGIGNGSEAIAFFRDMKSKIDLVILDMIMPGLSGSETFDCIRGVDPSVKVILCSGYSLDGQAQQILDKGCSGFIQKPFNITDLSLKIRDTLEG